MVRAFAPLLSRPADVLGSFSPIGPKTTRAGDGYVALPTLVTRTPQRPADAKVLQFTVRPADRQRQPAPDAAVGAPGVVASATSPARIRGPTSPNNSPIDAAWLLRRAARVLPRSYTSRVHEQVRPYLGRTSAVPRLCLPA